MKGIKEQEKKPTDLERARILLRPAYAAARASIDELDDIIGRNQNSGCGGDGSLSEGHWKVIRDCKNYLRMFKETAETLER